MGIADPKGKSAKSVKNIQDEVIAFQTELWSAEYLLNPTSDRPHQSLDVKPLNPALKDFSVTSREKRAQYIDPYIYYGTVVSALKAHSPSSKTTLVYINISKRQHYESVENKTVAELKKIISQEIQSVFDVCEALEMTWATITKKATKPVIINFYYELQVYRIEADQQAKLEEEATE